MTEQTVVALIATIPPTLMALAALISSMKNSVKLDQAKVKLEEVHVNTNGMKDKLVEQAHEAGKVVGKAEATAEFKAEI